MDIGKDQVGDHRDSSSFSLSKTQSIRKCLVLKVRGNVRLDELYDTVNKITKQTS